SPVHIDGGDGLDTLTVIGTDFGDDYVITDQGIFGGGLFITFQNVEKVIVDGQAGNDNFYVQSTSPNVLLELLGGLGSDTFNVGGGNNGQPITVVSNSLQGHSGLVAQLIQSADAAYNNLQAPWISANVADNSAPGVVVSQTAPVRVFEGAGAPCTTSPLAQGNLEVTSYRVVLSQAPTENVVIPAAPTPLPPSQFAAGAQNISLALEPASGQQPQWNAAGVNLVFTPGNWFEPQTVLVMAPNDGV